MILALVKTVFGFVFKHVFLVLGAVLGGGVIWVCLVVDTSCNLFWDLCWGHVVFDCFVRLLCVI